MKLYRNKHLLAIVFVIFGLTACDQLLQIAEQSQKQVGPPTNTEIVGALKDALIVGIQQTVTRTSQQNGYYGNSLIRIPFPEEAKQVETALRNLGQNKMVDDFVIAMNRSAEEASKKATDIFVASIRQMTIQDATGIWKGADNAATDYLKRTSYQSLMNEFRPVIQKSIQDVQVTSFWNPVVSTYNQIPLTRPVNPNLEDYIAEAAIEGLFKMVAAEELKIRKDPAARTTQLLRRVFGYQG
ncbi:MAG: DUF4197 domain-containing protein [Schleiferiaceae bacterium]|nr:DUF4197 domain-containing protein [Schleiferiaceae bacterium]